MKLTLTLIFLLIGSPALANEINVNVLADAIYLAEGGAHTSHPYGILTHYQHTTARQACINTINHRLNDFLQVSPLPNTSVKDYKTFGLNHPTSQASQFISYLGFFYCSLGAANDPGNLNVNWVRNVTALYMKRMNMEIKSDAA